MAETKTAEQTSSEEKNGSDGNSTRKSAVKAAAIAAASGATALAAKKAFSDRGPSRDREEKTKSRGGNDSLLSSVVSSSWDSARESLVPMLEDAAGHAGEYIARNAPDVISETIVPEFIRGFQRGSKSSSDDD